MTYTVFLFVQNIKIYKYAGDNTLSYCDYDMHKMVNTFETNIIQLLNLFSIYLMKANQDNFQTIAIGKKK